MCSSFFVVHLNFYRGHPHIIPHSGYTLDNQEVHVRVGTCIYLLSQALLIYSGYGLLVYPLNHMDRGDRGREALIEHIHSH